MCAIRRIYRTTVPQYTRTRLRVLFLTTSIHISIPHDHTHLTLTHCSLSPLFSLSFTEAVKGVDKKSFRLRMQDTCGDCKGSGSNKGGDEGQDTCPHCGGTGAEVVQQGPMRFQTACRRCQGEGRIISDPCNTCKGEGVVLEPKTIDLDVPAGVDTGMQMRLSGQGQAGRRGGGRGDIFLSFTVEPHAVFMRDGNNLRSECKLSIKEACLGATMDVETVDGNVDLKVPSGTQPGDTLLMRNKGVPVVNSNGLRGNHYIDLKVRRRNVCQWRGVQRWQSDDWRTRV